MGKIEVDKSQRLKVAADKCWDRVGGWATVHEWHPVIAKTETEGDGVGSLRTLTLGDGAVLKERLDAQDAAGMSYEYSFVEHPLPVDNYHGKISVADNGDGTSTLRWEANFVSKGVSDEEAKGIIEGIFQAGFDAMKSEFGE